MPAAVYWFGGLALAHGSHAISIATLVAFTTLQSRLFFPVGSLLGVGLDVQTSLALFDRIFDYLDQPVDIEERPDARDARRGRRRRLRPRLVPLRRATRGRSRTSRSRCRPARRPRSSARPARGRRRSATSRRASTTSSKAASRSAASTCATSRSRRSRDLVGVVSQETYLFHASVRDNLRFAKPDATDEEIEAAAEAARIHDADRGAARGLRHGRRRARLPLLRRREAAHRDRAHDPAQPADPRPRRGDELARQRDRAAGAGGARPARRGTDDDRDRAPPLDGARRRPDRRARPRPRSSSAAGTTSCSRVGGRYAELVGRSDEPLAV